MHKAWIIFGCLIISNTYAFAGTQQGWVENITPPDYVSVGDTFELSMTYYRIPTGEASQASFYRGVETGTGVDYNGAWAKWGTNRNVNGKLYQSVTITNAGNGSFNFWASASGQQYSWYDSVKVRTESTTLSFIDIIGDSVVYSGKSIDLNITGTSINGRTLSGGTQGWTVSPSSYAHISTTGVLSAQTTYVPRSVTVTASYTYWGINKTTNAVINVAPQCIQPVITPGDGTVFNSAVQKVTISTMTSNALVYFTTNGNPPTTSNTLYTSAFNIYDSTIIKAIVVKNGYADSDITTSIISKYKGTVETPLIVSSNISGTPNKVGHQLVSISCGTEGADIHYTLNNDIPDGASPLYDAPLEIFETTTINAVAIKSEFISSAISSLSVSNTVSLADALNMPTLIVASTGWTATTNTAQDGIYSAYSGTTSDNSTNTLSASIDGSGRLSFWWKASCEDDDFADNWDYLAFIVDGEEKQRIDGITSWQQYAIFLPQGTHEFRWEYRKDSSSFAGDDCGWLDKLSWVPFDECVSTNSPSRVPYAWLDKFELVSSNDYETAANALCANGYFAWESYLAGLDPTNSASKFVTFIAISNGQPKVTWTPDLGSNRVYKIYGKNSLLDSTWITPTNIGNRFFKVTAETD